MTKAELEEKISILLSCKNCPENKGGWICVKEYENKCLAQKIEYIKELKKENAELKDKLEILISVGNTCTKGLNKQLTKAKKLIKKLMNEFYYLCELYNFATDYECLAEAEQFLEEIE